MDARTDSHLTRPTQFIVNQANMGDSILKPVRPVVRPQEKEAVAEQPVSSILPPARRVLAGAALTESVDGKGHSRIGSSYFRLTPTATTALAF